MRVVYALGFTIALCTFLSAGDEIYKLGPESMRQDGVPQGKITHHIWKSQIFEGTIRHYSIYVPAQYDGSQKAALMVFQDGHAYLGEKGQFRAPIVLDNLIHQGDMPITIGIFIDPGHKKEKLPEKRGWRPTPENRSFEYDTLSDQYVRFLIEEIIPEVAKSYKLTDDPEQRAICGISSGGICSFTAAWERPDYFRKVLSHVGSFTNIRGGHHYQAMLRKTEKKPIRVFLQAGSGDLNNTHGNWPLGNLQLAKSLEFKDYDYKLVYGEGAHNGIHGGAILPDSMRWLWRDSPVRKRGSEVKLLADEFKFTEGPASDKEGNVYFTDQPNDRILKWSVEGKLSTFLQPAGRSNGLFIDADGNIMACADENNQLWRISPDGKKRTVVHRFQGLRLNGPNDLWINDAGGIYFTDPFYKRPWWKHNKKEQDTEAVYYRNPETGNVHRVATGFKRPNGIVGSFDQQTLYVADIGDRKTYSFKIAEDGSLVDRKLFCKMGSDGMTIDHEGNLYLTGKGVIVFNPEGKEIDRIPIKEGWTANVCFGGPDRRTLFITAMDSLYSVDMRVRGAEALSPPPPQKPTPGKQVEQNFVQSGKVLSRYQLFLPKFYKSKKEAPDKAWPLIIFLHGRGESYGPLSFVKKWGVPRIADRDPNFQFIAVSPQCPGDDHWKEDTQQEVLSKLLTDVLERYNVDSKRVYLTGLSMGGYGSWRFAARESHRLAAVVPVCGGGRLEDAPTLKDLPIWAFHGDKDTVIPILRSQEMVDAIKKAGGTKIKFTSLEGFGHNSWSATYADPGLYSWLLRQSRP